MACLPGLLQLYPLSLQQVTAELCLCRKQTLKGKSGSVSYGVPVSWCAQGFVCVPQEFPQSVYVLAALLLLLSRFSGV